MDRGQQEEPDPDERPAADAAPEAHKPAFWWAIEREPWTRVSASIEAAKKAGGRP